MENHLNTLKKDQFYHSKSNDQKILKSWCIIIVNYAKWVLQKYPMNACGLRVFVHVESVQPSFKLHINMNRTIKFLTEI